MTDRTVPEWMHPLPVRRVVAAPDAPSVGWPFTLAPVRQLLTEGLDLGRVTVLVGENGVGKSTLVEAIAMAYGLSAEGGGTGAMHHTRATESALDAHLRLERGVGATRWGYFLRAETMHGLFSYLAENPGDGPDPDFHALSHGQSFLAMVASGSRFARGGFVVLDEPEAGLSFGSQLEILDALTQISRHPHGQVLLATHSPLLAALPGARVLELDDRGITETEWRHLDLVHQWRRFLDDPGFFVDP